MDQDDANARERSGEEPASSEQAGSELVGQERLAPTWPEPEDLPGGPPAGGRHEDPGSISSEQTGTRPTGEGAEHAGMPVDEELSSEEQAEHPGSAHPTAGGHLDAEDRAEALEEMTSGTADEADQVATEGVDSRRD